MTRQFLLDAGNGLSRIQVLGTDLGTVHDGMATVQLQGIIHLLQSFGSGSVTRILHPSVGLHQDGWSQVGVGIPPITGTGSRTARTENTFVHTIQLGTVLACLQEFSLAFLLGSTGLQPGLDALVLFVKVGHVRDQVFQHKHVWKRVDFGSFGLGINVTEASQCIGSINIHGTGSADSFAARSSKSQCRILFALDFDERIQDHGSAVVDIHGVSAQVRCLHGILGVPTVNFEIDEFLRLGCRRSGKTATSPQLAAVAHLCQLKK